tara:strand:- start:6187 stop:6615 length:429 start_codon:yes stop_codon:yes gene_type:complete
MGKINSRNKGASFERDIANKINDFLEQNCDRFPKFKDIPKVKRNLDQYQEKGLGDLELPNHIIECKRYASGNWYKQDWWEQTVTSRAGNIPVLIWKYNHQPIRVCLPLSVLSKNWRYPNRQKTDVTAVIEFETWLWTLCYNL